MEEKNTEGINQVRVEARLDELEMFREYIKFILPGISKVICEAQWI